MYNPLIKLKHESGNTTFLRASLIIRIEKWDEKITDTINYLFILKAIVEEESYEKNRSKDS